MPRPRETVWSALRIAIKPTALANEARRIALTSAYFLGVGAAVFSTIIAFHAAVAGMGEPFGDMSVWYSELLSINHVAIFGMLVPFWSVLLGFFVIVGTSTNARGHYYCTILVLLPLVMFIPALVWSIGNALLSAQQDVVNKPPWLDSPLIGMWGSWKCFFAIVAVALACGIHAARRFGEFPEDDETLMCEFCSYNLTGNISGVCPECGKTIEIARHD